MAREGKWAVGSNQYRKRLRRPQPGAGVRLQPATESARARMDACGITWDDGCLDLSLIPATSTDRARIRFRAALPELIWNTAALEGNTYTLPEVRTLLEGITIGGRPLQETEQILALRDAYHRLDDQLRVGSFSLSKPVSDELQGLLARHESIECGHFRGEGTATGGGHVILSTGERAEGTPHGEDGQDLVGRYDNLANYLDGHLQDPRAQALVYFASVVRTQFYCDGNKRTARLMMAGHLIASGFEAVSIPNARRLEFNRALDRLFATDDATDLIGLLCTCAPREN